MELYRILNYSVLSAVLCSFSSPFLSFFGWISFMIQFFPSMIPSKYTFTVVYSFTVFSHFRTSHSTLSWTAEVWCQSFMSIYPPVKNARILELFNLIHSLPIYMQIYSSFSAWYNLYKTLLLFYMVNLI